MEFKSYRYRVLFRLLLLVVTIFLIVYAFSRFQWYVTRIGLLVILIFQIVDLIRFHERWIKKFSHLLDLIRMNDFSYRFSNSNEDSGIKKFESSMDAILEAYRNLRINKEAHYQYLLTVLEHSKTATLCFDEEGKIHLTNRACRDLFAGVSLSNINTLSSFSPLLLDQLKGDIIEEKQIIHLKRNRIQASFSLSVTSFFLQEQSYRLVSFSDVTAELENQEQESYKKLVRVLIHEIMNSITPITSLSVLLKDVMNTYVPGQMVDKDDLLDLQEGLSTIVDRSKSLTSFVKRYKKISQLPKPVYSNIDLIQLVKHVKVLMQAELNKKGVQLVIKSFSNNSKWISGDHDMLMQVLINLVTNAWHSCIHKENPCIEIGYKILNRQFMLWIRDNGSGMSKEVQENIFVPFFTTKKSGSGIGLSLSKEILRLHNASIHVESEINKGSCFTLGFELLSDENVKE
ncbi:MAG: PAS domain-containing sensor histidine kinase [Bacteroidales bacterium]